ncbi:MAG TPA: hypothetical protein VLL27_03185 [Solirubrobacterales bacterium]|nr:hypothetical protein [Solirubrobacterales bacterium]
MGIVRLIRRAWTDERMDDLNAKVDKLDERVDRLDARVGRLEVEMRAGFVRIDQRLDRLIFILFGLFATVLAAFLTHL